MGEVKSRLFAVRAEGDEVGIGEIFAYSEYVTASGNVEESA